MLVHDLFCELGLAQRKLLQSVHRVQVLFSGVLLYQCFDCRTSIRRSTIHQRLARKTNWLT